MAEPLWVAQLIISEETARKLSARHGLDANSVRDAIVCIAGLRCAWHYDERRGWRAMVEAFIDGRRVIAVLYPVKDPSGDVFALGSAYPR